MGKRNKVIFNDLPFKEAIKWYTLVTNNFGMPTDDNLDFFCKEFGYKILSESIVLPTKKEFNNLWNIICNELNERKQLIKTDDLNKLKGMNAQYNYGWYFYKLIAKNLSTIRAEIKSAENNEEELINRFKECLKQLKFERLNINKEIIEEIEDVLTSGMYGDDLRVIGIPTGEPNENLWYVYNYMRNELKPIKGSEHNIELENKPWDEYVQSQSKRIIDYLDEDCVDLYMLKGELLDDTPAEILTGFNLINKTEQAKVEVKQKDKIEETIKQEDIATKSDDKAKKIIDNQAQIASASAVYEMLAGMKIAPLKENKDTKEDNKNNEETEVYKQLYFDKTPNLIKIDRKGRRYIQCKFCNIAIDAKGRLYEDNTLVVERDSKVGDIKSSAMDTTLNSRRKYKNYINKDNRLVQDIVFSNPSGAGAFVYGGNSNGWISWLNMENKQIKYYTIPSIKDEIIDTVNKVDDTAENTKEEKISIKQEENKSVKEQTNTIEKIKAIELPAPSILFNKTYNLDLTPDLIKQDELGEYIKIHVEDSTDNNEFRIYRNGLNVVMHGAQMYKLGHNADNVIFKIKKYREQMKLSCNTNFKLSYDIGSKSMFELSHFVYGKGYYTKMVNDNGQPLALYCDKISIENLNSMSTLRLNSYYIKDIAKPDSIEVEIYSEKFNIRGYLNINNGKVRVTEKDKYIILEDNYNRIDHMLAYIYKYNENIYNMSTYNMSAKQKIINSIKDYLKEFVFFDEVNDEIPLINAYK